MFSVPSESKDPLPMNRTKLSLSTPEGLSALVDGELDDEAVAELLDACTHDEVALACWSRYHLIGEVLRAPAQAPSGATLDAELAFVSRLSQRLAQESVALPVGLGQPAVELAAYREPAANDGNFRWKLLAGFASLAAMSAIAWNVSERLTPQAPQLARADAAQVLVASPQGTMVRDARLQELLAAHKQFGATSALQEPSGFLHNAAFEMPQEALSGR